MAEAAPRDIRIDAFRGVAILCMIAYHVVWDLAALGFIDPTHASSPGFRRLGATIASAFLWISGVALVLMRHRIADDADFRRKFLRRLLIIAGAAALVSLGTWFAMGDRFVRFGILHCIAASSLVALPFLRLPAWAAGAGAAAMLSLPWLVDLPGFKHPALLWLGLSSAVPSMVDYVPVFPFAGMALLGVAAGPAIAARLGQRHDAGRADTWLARLGRWSLPIYLIHQPVLYGGLFLLASLTATVQRPAGDALDRDTAGFRTECRRSCEGQGNDRGHCDRYCACAETEMKAGDLWRRAMAGQDMAAIQAELDPLLQACFSRARTP